MSKITVGHGVFDGVGISNGTTPADIIETVEDNSKTLYVSSLSDLPAPTGNEIFISRAILGGLNTIKATGVVDISPNVLVVDDVSTGSNGSTGATIYTENATKPLIRTVDNSPVSIKDVVLTNPIGKIFQCINTNGIALGKSCGIKNVTIGAADSIGEITHFFLIELDGFAIVSTVNGGLKIGAPTNPSAILISINDIFTVAAPTAGGNLFDIDTTIPVGTSITMSNMGLTSAAGFYGVNITNIANVAGVNIKSSSFNGAGEAVNGFNAESPNVTIAEDCSGVITTPVMYWAKYQDDATQTTPIVLPNAADTKLTCDGVAGIEKHLPSTITDLWDTTANKIRLDDLPVGRSLTVIINMTINVNQNTTTVSLFGKGLDTAQTIFNADTVAVNRKNAEVEVEKWLFVDVVDSDLQTNGIELFLRIDDPATATGTVKVNHILPKRG
jgi:hypothetical protein